jgi:lysophospholipase L1-like esterase
MCRKILINGSVLLLLLAFLVVFYTLCKSAKQKWIVYKTLHSWHWNERKVEIENARPGRYKVIFLGNSLTEMFDLDFYFNNPTILNCGIVGDFSEGLVKRADAVVKLKPEKLFIEIGINDIIEQVSLEDICKNCDILISRIQEESPLTKIYIQSNLPVIMYRPGIFVTDKYVNEKIYKQNKNLEKLAERKGVVFIDLHTPFLRSGYLKDLLIEDGVHLTGKAYGVWKMTVIPYLYPAER